MYDLSGVTWKDHHPSYFRLGSAAYKSHITFNEVSKRKWVLDDDIPDFIDDKKFIVNVLETGLI